MSAAGADPAAAPPGRAAWQARTGELARFGSVGLAAYAVDLLVFNVFRILVGTSPITAKVVSVAVATLVAWWGNRNWTFAKRRTSAQCRELLWFAIVNVAGLAIGVACLWVSHYLLGLNSPLADNISGNVVGLALGTAFRYVAYRRWVFTG